jgi:radical SAM protein with 4Fe4S-binding SPASM domain
MVEKAVCVTPGARLTACHGAADDGGFLGTQFDYGQFDPASQQFVIDPHRLDSMLSDLAYTPDFCRECIASIQCTAGCYFNNLLVSGKRMGQDSEWCRSSRELVCRLLEEELHSHAQIREGGTEQ